MRAYVCGLSLVVSGKRYSDDPEVVRVASNIVLIYVLYMFTSAMMWAIRGNLNGCGKQAIAAKLGLFASYAIGVPLAVVLCFVAEWGLAGLWWGLVAGNVCNVMMCGAVWYRIDWPKEAVRARERAKAKRQGTEGHNNNAGKKP